MNHRTKKGAVLASVAVIAIGASAALVTAQEPGLNPQKMSFFVTSVGSGKGGDLGGIAGADAHCTELARAAGSPASKEWKAYLSLAPMDGQPKVDARDRIGTGPWYNAKGVEIAANVDELHSENAKMTKETNLTEKGAVNPGYQDTTNIHDAITGSDAQGRLAAPQVNAPRANEPPTPLPPNMTCNNYTSSDPQLVTMQGHIDRRGFTPLATSWNAAHPSRGCSAAGIASTGSSGQYYCFARN